MVKCNWTRSWV